MPRKALRQIREAYSRADWEGIRETSHRLIPSYKHLSIHGVVSDLIELKSRAGKGEESRSIGIPGRPDRKRNGHGHQGPGQGNYTIMKPIKHWFRKGSDYKLGIVLSGGGARGFAHAGILKALNEKGIYPEIISGVSAGAIVGALYADGHTPDEILDIFSRNDSFFKYVKFTVPRKSLFKAEGLRQKPFRSFRG